MHPRSSAQSRSAAIATARWLQAEKMGRGAPVTAFVTFDSEETRLACLRKAKSQSKPLPPKYLGRQLTIKPVRKAALSPQRARVLCGHAQAEWAVVAPRGLAVQSLLHACG